MNDISHVIQLAVAPVFLLAGIGAFVNACASRLSRIFDRSHVLESRLAAAESEEQQQTIKSELVSLRRRARMIYAAIALDIIAALLVCILIVFAFAAYYFGFEYRGLIGGLFSAAMLSLIGGLIAFLREVFIAVRRLSIRLPHRR